MAREVRAFAALIPAATPLATPVTIALTMPPRIVEAVRFRIPPGPSGNVGFALAASGVRIIPWGPNQWIVGDGEVIDWPLTDQIESGAWQLQGYNVGRWDHTIQVQFLLDVPGARGAAAILPPLTLEPVGEFVGPSGPPYVPPPVTSPPEPLPGPEPGPVVEPPPPVVEPPPVIEPPPPPPPPPTLGDGYAAARTNAVAAIEGAFGLPLDVAPTTPPPPGTAESAAYDSGRAAAIAALVAL